MKAIVVVDNNWAIGYEGKLLVHLPEDLKYFKKITSHKAIIMGRKTLESLPNAKPLPNRHNIVLTKNKDYKVDGAVVLNSVDQVLEYVKNMLSEDVFVIGGDEIYRQFLPYVDECYVTKINYSYSADTFFQNLDNNNEWEVVETSKEQSYFSITYSWNRYKRKSDHV